MKINKMCIFLLFLIAITVIFQQNSPEKAYSASGAWNDAGVYASSFAGGGAALLQIHI